MLPARPRQGEIEINQAQPVSFLQLSTPPEHDLETLRPQVLRELQAIVGPENLLSDEADLIAYSIDGTRVERRPLAVVLPASAGEVSAVLRLANREHIVIAPRGSASGLSGGSVPLGGGPEQHPQSGQDFPHRSQRVVNSFLSCCVLAILTAFW